MKKFSSTKNFVFIFPLVLLVVCAAISYYIPIYDDEFIYKVSTSRYFFDFRNAFDFLPQCHNSIIKQTPFYFKFHYFLRSIWYNNFINLQFIRSSGIFFGLVIVFLLVNIVPRINSIYKKNPFISLIPFSYLFLGVLPFLFFLNRPEQTILLSITFFIAIYFYSLKVKNDKERFILILVLQLIFIYAIPDHATSLFLIFPFGYLCLSIPSKKKQKIFSLSLCIYIFISAYIFYSKECESAPFLNSVLLNQALNPSSLFGMSFLNLCRRIYDSIFYNDLIANILFQKNYQSDWITGMWQITKYDSYLNTIIVIFFKILNILVLSLITYNIYYSFKYKKFRSHFFIALSLYLSQFSLNFFMNSSSFYRSSLEIPLGIIVFSLLIMIPSNLFKYRKSLNMISIFFLVTSLLFPMRMLFLRDNFIPTVQFITSNEIKDIQSAYKLCSFHDSSRSILMDQRTLRALWSDVQLPIMTSPATSGYWGRDVVDLKSFLLGLNSSGIFIKCEDFPKQFRDSMISIDGTNMCCIKF